MSLTPTLSTFSLTWVTEHWCATRSWSLTWLHWHLLLQTAVCIWSSLGFFPLLLFAGSFFVWLTLTKVLYQRDWLLVIHALLSPACWHTEGCLFHVPASCCTSTVRNLHVCLLTAVGFICFHSPAIKPSWRRLYSTRLQMCLSGVLWRTIRQVAGHNFSVYVVYWYSKRSW